MTAYNVETADEKGRQIHPVLFNTAKDGSGTWYFPLLDSDGHLQVDVLSQTAGTTVIGKVRLVDSAGNEVTNATYDAVNVTRVGGGVSSSGIKSADTAIKASAGKVYWLTVSDTAALAIELNDSTAGAGTDQWGVDLPADAYAHFIFDPPLEFTTGIYLDVSTATCKVTVGYI